jgi:hypothetical protein
MFTKDLGLTMETSTVNTMVSEDTRNGCIHNFQLSFGMVGICSIMCAHNF